jgi:hypothetical protein
VNEPAIPLVDGKYKGLTDDPTQFNIAAGKVFNVFKPQVGDEIILSIDGISNSKSSNTFIVPQNNSLEFAWAANASGVSMAFEYLETTTIKVPNGTFYGNRVTAYKFKCVVA